MATYVPPKRATEFIFYISLISQADTKLLKSTPTLAAGDFIISKDGGGFVNLNTLPTVTPAAGYAVKVLLSATEMTADNVMIICHDAAGAEWCDMAINIQTAARQVDDLAYPATTGRSMVVDANGLVDANAVKVGPTGAGTAQTAGDIKAETALIKASTDLVTAARMGALDDWIDAGRLDTILDAVKVCTDRLTAARAGALDDWLDAGRLDLLLDAIKACTDLITAARMGALTDWVDAGRLDLLLDAIKAKTDLTALDSTVAKEATLNTKIPTALSFTGANVNTESKVTAPPTDMALNSTVAKDATVAKPANILVTPANLLATDATGRVTPVDAGSIRKNTTLANFTFLMVDATDGLTAETGLVVTAQRSIDGAVFGACANVVAELANGIYKIDLAATDLNGDVITLRFSAAGALDRFVTIKTAP